MSSGSGMEWQAGGPPPTHRSGYNPYDSPSPYDGHPPPHEARTPPYGSYHGPPHSHQHMMPPRGAAGPPPPSDYWTYDQPPLSGPSRRHPPAWRGIRGAPHDSPGASYEHRMGPPPPSQHHGGYPAYPQGQTRHYYSQYGTPPHVGGRGPPPRGPEGRPYMPDVPRGPPREMQARGPPTAAAASVAGMRTPPRAGAASRMYGTPIRSAGSFGGASLSESKKPPQDDDEANDASDGKSDNEKKSKSKGKGKGDPLSLLAKVCKQEQESEEEAQPEAPATPKTPAPVPTSPAHRRPRPSPVVTPASTPMGKPPLMPHPQISPVDSRATGGYWAAEPAPDTYPRRQIPATPARANEDPATSSPYPPRQPASGPSTGPGGTPAPYTGSWQEESPTTPAVVERGSFDSVEAPLEHGSMPYDAPRRGPYYGGPSTDYPRGPLPPHAPRKYPPPRWSSYPIEHGVRPGSYSDMGPPPGEYQHHPGPPQHYPPHTGSSQNTPPSYGEGPPPYPAPRHYPPPPHAQSFPPPHHRYNGRNPPPPHTPMHPYRHDGGGHPAPHPMTYAPYTYVQQPHLEEKTVLRKKFSWKHYPELERFLIANRDDYLKHSSMNYTAEQKSYNNWLTERLLEVAAEHHYAFDPEDFNFVAIRDRIRCYYKSYVQTARKRGMSLPSANKNASFAETDKKKARTDSNSDESGENKGEKQEDAKTDKSKDAASDDRAADEKKSDGEKKVSADAERKREDEDATESDDEEDSKPAE